MADQFKRLAGNVTEEECARAKNVWKGAVLGYQDSHDGLQSLFAKVGVNCNNLQLRADAVTAAY